MLAIGMVNANDDLLGSAGSIVIFPEKSLNRPWMLLIPDVRDHERNRRMDGVDRVGVGPAPMQHHAALKESLPV